MQTVSLSSAGVSAAIALDYIGAKRTSYSIAATSSGAVSYAVQGSLDAPQLVTTLSWFDISSSVATSTAIGGTFNGPLAAIRLRSSAISGTATLESLQNAGG